jgi:arylformamidase
MTENLWIDVTLPVSTSMPVLPDLAGDQKVLSPRVERFFDVDKGDKVTMSRIEINSHEGTHIDAPLHFFYGGKTIDQMPLDTTVGPARVIEIKDQESIKRQELEPYNIYAEERLLFKTHNSPGIYSRINNKAMDFVYISTEAAQYLVEKKVRVVGLDYLTIGKITAPSNIKEVHETFLGNGVFVIEGLDLSGVKAGPCELVCLPLRLERGDAAPARVLVKPLG